MGLQIIVKQKDMLDAGWTVLLSRTKAVYSLGEYEFVSNDPVDFMLDCNLWGENIKLLQQLGVLAIPHILV